MDAAPEPNSRDVVHTNANVGIVEFLRHHSSYPEHTTTVECIETHISWVFLTDSFVYKLKKPVHFDFLDFSTPERRRWACEQEVILNLRLAPNVYIGAVPIKVAPSGHLAIGGSGETVDWVVKMRRLQADAALDQQLAVGKLTEADADRIAARLVEFYEQLPPVTVETDDYRRAIEGHVAANERELLCPEYELADTQIRRVHGAQRRLLRLAPDLLDDRVRGGRIVDGHGDLRPEHIYLNATPVVIDCIEFSTELRMVDVVDELGFLAMECDHMGASWVGERVLQRYRNASGDNAPTELLQFYQSYRACVRAKVCVLRARQLESVERSEAIVEAEGYLQLADSYAKPFLLVIRGLPGTGKSTLAEVLAKQLECELLQTDAIRRELFGLTEGGAGYNKGRYRQENRMSIYAEMFQRASAALCQGLSVILDGTFLRADLRREACRLAECHFAKPLIVQCTCPEDVATARIAERATTGESASETLPEFYHKQRDSEEPESSDLPVCVVDTSESLVKTQRTICSQLRGMLYAPIPESQS